MAIPRVRLTAVFLFLFITLVSGCEPGPGGPFDSGLDTPVLSNLSLSVSVIDTDTIFVGEDRLPEDDLRISLVASVDVVRSTPGLALTATVTSDDGRRIPTEHALNDAGTSPDTVAGDGRFTGSVAFTVRRALVGAYTVSVNGTDEQGYVSGTLATSIALIRSNLPPFLSDLEADSIFSASSEQTTLQVRIRVTDPNGLQDVRRVWFDSFRPGDIPSSQNPFLLFDDGDPAHGDAQAGDGLYGLKIQSPQGAPVGIYTFVFRATDRSRDTSNVVTHQLSVVP